MFTFYICKCFSLTLVQLFQSKQISASMFSRFTLFLTFQTLNVVQDFGFYFLVLLLWYLINFYFVNIILLLFDGLKKGGGVGLESWKAHCSVMSDLMIRSFERNVNPSSLNVQKADLQGRTFCLCVPEYARRFSFSSLFEGPPKQISQMNAQYSVHICELCHCLVCTMPFIFFPPKSHEDTGLLSTTKLSTFPH